MASPLPSSGSLSIGEIRAHCTDNGGTGAVALHADIQQNLWFDTYGFSGIVDSWNGLSVSLYSNVNSYTYRNTVDTNLTITLNYTFYNSYANDFYNPTLTILSGNSSGSGSDFPACYGLSPLIDCYVVASSFSSASPYYSGDLGTQDNVGWYRGKLRYNIYGFAP